MNDITIKDFIILKKENNFSIVVTEKEEFELDFSERTFHIKDNFIVFEPAMYSSIYNYLFEIDDKEHLKALSKIDSITVAKVRETGVFDDIYLVERDD